MGQEMSTIHIDGQDWKSPVYRARERLNKALDTYMDLRERQGIGHVSDEGKELAAAYQNLKLVQKSYKDGLLWL